jgi:hypothetical protein
MRWRLIVLGLLAVVLGIGCALSALGAVDAAFRAQEIFGDPQNPPGIEQQAESNRMYQLSYGLQLLMTPLAFGSLASALAVPAVLGRRWQLREAEGSDARRGGR